MSHPRVKELEEKYVGQIINKLEIIGVEKKNINYCLKFKCHCGKIGLNKTSLVINGTVKSCGCGASSIKKLTKEYYMGKTFNLLTVINITEDENKVLIAECNCKCGNKKITKAINLNSNSVKSCGCLRITKESKIEKSKKYKYQSKKDWSIYVGKTFSNLKILSLVRPTIFLCECKCKNQIEHNASLVVKEKIKTCGSKECSKKQPSTWDPKTMVGQKFNHLIIKSIEFLKQKWKAECLCDCGNTKKLTIGHVISGRTKSCGCRISVTNKNQKEGELRKCRGRCGQLKELNDKNFPKRDNSTHLWRWTCIDCKKAPPLTPKQEAELTKKREQKAIQTKLHSAMSRSQRYHLKKNGGKKDAHTFATADYDVIELEKHLESLFEPWMNKDNHGSYNPKTWRDDDSSTWKWSIDHIIPASDFDFQSCHDEDFKKCWSLSNLRPLSAKQNWYDGINRTRHTKPKLSSRLTNQKHPK